MEWVQFPLCAYLVYLLKLFRWAYWDDQSTSTCESSQIKAEVTHAVLLALLGKLAMCLLAIMSLNFPVEETLLELWVLVHLGQVYAALYRLTDLLSADRKSLEPFYRDKCLLWSAVCCLTAFVLILVLGKSPHRLEFCLFLTAEVYMVFWTSRTHFIFQGIERGFTHPFELTADRKDFRQAVP